MTGEEARVEVIAWWLEKADEALASADSELAAGRCSFAVNRAYYAAFYAVSAALLREGARYTKHSGVRAAMHRDLVKTGRLPEGSGRAFDRLFESRQRADYGELVAVEAEQARELCELAHGLVAEVRRMIDEG